LRLIKIILLPNLENIVRDICDMDDSREYK
jgi:hypothetical protein